MMSRLFTRRNEPQQVEITVSNATILRIVGLVVFALLALLAIRTAAHALLLIFIAFFLVLALNAPVHVLAQRLPVKRRGSRSLATTISFLVIVLILGAFIASIAPPIIRQTQSFIKAAPTLVSDVKSQDSDIGRLVRRYHLEGQINAISSQLSDRLKHASGTAVSTLASVGGSVVAVLTVLVLTFMMLVEGPHWLTILQGATPSRHRPAAVRLSIEMYRVVKGYVNGQVTLAAIAAVLMLPMLLILGISYPVALMVVVFICGLIPMVGHTFGAIIVTIVALFHSPLAAAIILAYYILYQQIENYLIQPRIQANTTNLSPLLVFMAVVIGASFNGLLGGLVAIPIAGCLRVLVLEYVRRRNILADEGVDGNPVIDDTK